MTELSVCTALISSPCTPLVKVMRLPGLAPLRRSPIHTDLVVDICTPWKYRRYFFRLQIIGIQRTHHFLAVDHVAGIHHTNLAAAEASLRACAIQIQIRAIAAISNDCIRLRRLRPSIRLLNIVSSLSEA